MRSRRLVPLATVLGAALVAGSAAAQPVSHLGQRIEDHIVLTGWSSPQGSLYICDWHHVPPDGRVSQNPPDYSIPAGRRLVVTDVEWFANWMDAQGGYTIDAVDMRIYLSQGSLYDVNALSPVFRSRTVPMPVQATGDRVPRAGSNEQLTTGFVVAAGTEICAVTQGLLGTSGGGFTEYLPGEATLRGYLIDAP